MDKLTNLFADIPANLPEELFQTILANARFRIERIVSLGHASPEGAWYDQDEHEWVLLVKGAARLRFEDDEATVEMKPGSFINIPPPTSGIASSGPTPTSRQSGSQFTIEMSHDEKRR